MTGLDYSTNGTFWPKLVPQVALQGGRKQPVRGAPRSCRVIETPGFACFDPLSCGTRPWPFHQRETATPPDNTVDVTGQLT